MGGGLDIRQRHAVATSNSYTTREPSNSVDSTANIAPYSPFSALSSRWRMRRLRSPLPMRFGMRLLEIVALAVAMLVAPSLMQYVVRSVNELYEIVGRRSRSPFASVPTLQVLTGILAFFVYHTIVIGLALVVMGKSTETEQSTGDVIGQPNRNTQKSTLPRPWLRIRPAFFLVSYLILAGLWFLCQLALSLVRPSYAASKSDGLP